MAIGELKNKLVAVLGFGQEGEATVKYLIKNGVAPTIFDQRPWNEWSQEKQEQIKSLKLNFIFGPDAFNELTGFDLIFRSPGIKLFQIPTNKSKLTSQTKWFFDNCPANIIGITGTKGKGTTASLIYQMLKNYFKPEKNLDSLRPNIYLTGNIGKIQPFEFIDNLTPDDWVVYELSSFQLQDLDKSPKIGVILMTTSEHLDYHGNNSEYLEAKSPIVKFQTENDTAIINFDYENSRKIGLLGKGKKIFYSLQSSSADCFIKTGAILLKNSDFVFKVSELGLVGQHNQENACAAVLAAKCAGCNDTSIKLALHEFKGLEHRLEFVEEINRVKFYNDSFSTTPETAIAAINSFGQQEILILGGSSKKSDFSELGKVIQTAKNIKALILIGNEAVNIRKAIGEFSGVIVEGPKSMSEVFQTIQLLAKSGDIVILTPACASFDMFKNYKDRGEQFKKFVLKLKKHD